jgi:hypothetical protein
MREVAADGPWAGKLAGAAGARTTMESVTRRGSNVTWSGIVRW